MRRMARHTLAILAMAAGFGAASPAAAVVTLTASRAEVLFTADENPDCKKLHAIADSAQLPLNVVRLSVLVDGQVPPPGTKIKWSFPDPAVGILAADEDLGPSDSSAGIVGFCAEFGNECTLTKQKLAFYNKPTILWLGPTCDTLPENTERVFPGGTVKFRVKIPKQGKAKATVDYGRSIAGAVTLLATGNGVEDGIGKPGGVLTGFKPGIGALIDWVGPPAIDSLKFAPEQGDTFTTPGPCSGICGEILFPAEVGSYLATLTAKLQDGSALCDRLRCNVGPCEGRPKLEIITTPKRQTYRDGQTVRLRVRMHAIGGCNAVLRGNVLSCNAQLKVGGLEDEHQDELDFQRCSTTDAQPCDRDADCECTPANCPCPDCQPNEFCLTYSHCSQTIERQCEHATDCAPPLCPECRDDETCVNVVPISSATIPAGQFLDLLDTNVAVKNVLPDTAQIEEEWTGHTYNLGDASDKIRYRIRGRR
jgi:hypothetical protein